MAELLQQNPVLFIVFVSLLGLIVGSFLNVVIYRLPVMKERGWKGECRELLGLEPEGKLDENRERFNLVVPRSRCPQCGHGITALENIPVISYLLQRGRCKSCGAPISARYPAVELLTAVLSGLAAWHFGFGLAGFAAVALTWALICLTFIDLDHQLLPDDITLPFLWAGLGLSLVGVFVDSHSAIIGAIAGYLSLWLVYHAFRILTGKEGMGYGDFKLFALFGAWFGWQSLPLIILLSSVVGAVVGIGMIVFRGHDRAVPIPFGPYLAAAGWIAMLWGDAIMGAYMTWITPA